MELKDLKVNIEKTKVMRSGKKWWRDSKDWKMAMCSVGKLLGQLHSMH